MKKQPPARPGQSPAGGGDTAILVVSFGTSYNDSRERTIGAIEGAIASAFPGYQVRRAFTSPTILRKLARRDGLEIDNVPQALDRAAADGVDTLIVQPTHLMDGLEYARLVEELEGRAHLFAHVALGAPLLTSQEDFQAVLNALSPMAAPYRDGQTAVVFLGHGTEAASNSVYARLQDMLFQQGLDHCFIGTVEASPALQDVVSALAGRPFRRVVLIPLMVVAGDHANHDMAGEEEGSWKSVLTRAGYQVECLLRGLGEDGDIRAIYVSHVRSALAGLGDHTSVPGPGGGETGHGL